MPAVYRCGQVTVSHNPAPCRKAERPFLVFLHYQMSDVIGTNRRIAWEVCGVETAHSASWYIPVKITAIHVTFKVYTSENETGNVCMNVAWRCDQVTTAAEKRILHILRWPGSSVGIATELRAGRSGIESRCRRDFSARLDRPWGPPNLL